MKKKVNKSRNKKHAFTLVELLAVIVILAIILVIAVPQIMDTIEASKKSSLESSTKLVASSLENDYQSSLAAGTTFSTSGSCASYVDSNEYSACTYTISDSGEATVTLTGKDNGKFNGLKASGTKNNASIVTGPALPTAKANFAAYTWSEIQTLAKAAKDGNITYAELSSTYNLAVGQTRCIDLTGFTTTNDNSCGTSGTAHSGFSVRIANMSNGEDNTCGTTGFSETACGFVIEFVDIIIDNSMNESKTNVGGWESAEMRAYLNSVVYNALPSDLQGIISETTVVSGHGSTSGETNFTTTDKLYLLSTHEIWLDADGNTSSSIDYYDTGYNNTRQLDYYKNLGETTGNNYSNAIKKLNSSNHEWWLRGAASNDPRSFTKVYSDGYPVCYWANLDIGVSPAFRIG